MTEPPTCNEAADHQLSAASCGFAIVFMQTLYVDFMYIWLPGCFLARIGRRAITSYGHSLVNVHLCVSTSETRPRSLCTHPLLIVKHER